MNILIIGCGKLGSSLADKLFHHGHDVSIISEHEKSLSRLSDDFDGLTVVGVPMDMNILKSAGVEGCDAVAIVTGYDNVNITVAQIIQEFFNVENVVVRISDVAREKVFRNFGMNTICQTKLSCEAIFADLVQKSTERQFTVGMSTFAMRIRKIDPQIIGRSLDKVPQKPGELIIGVLKNDKVQLLNKKETIILNPEDKLLVVKLID